MRQKPLIPPPFLSYALLASFLIFARAIAFGTSEADRSRAIKPPFLHDQFSINSSFYQEE
jgi:hypothetical protein